jgi:hypothetical protein
MRLRAIACGKSARLACLLIFPRPKQRKARPPPLLANYHRKEDESRLIVVMMSSDQAERTEAFGTDDMRNFSSVLKKPADH